MRRTDFCLLTSSYEHPRLAGSRMRQPLSRLRSRRDRLFHGSAIRFGGPHVSPSRVTAVGLLFPSRCVRAGPLTSLSPLPRVSPRSRGVRTRESRRDRLQLTRVNGASRADDPGCLPSGKDPSPRDALSSARLRTSPGSRFGHRMPGSRRLFTPGCSCEHPGAGLPSTCPVANGSHASSSLGAACRLLQPEYDARAHPSSCRPSHASGAFAPLLAGTNRCRLRWPPRCVAAPRACEPRPVHTDLRAACSACADETNRGPKRSSKGDFARSWTMSRMPFSWRFGHPGHRLDPSRRLEDLRDSSRRPRPPSDASPRRETPSKRSGCLLPRWNPYASGGLLLRARLDRGPVTPPPQRHCSGARAPFSPFPQRLPLTRKALEPARPTEPWEPKPPRYDQSQRPSRLLRPNQLAG
jgi:hypothetical protein